MPDYGPWHKLTISTMKVYSIPSFTGEVTEELIYELDHPEECNPACTFCGHHNNCSIDWELNNSGAEIYNGLGPGEYKARFWHDKFTIPEVGTEHDIGVEIVPNDAT